MVSCSNETKSEWISVTGEKSFDKDDSIVFTEQFVKQVHHFSSQYGSDISISYTAYNIAGNPSKFPDYGDFPEAFVMRTYGSWWDEAPSKLIDYMPQNNEDVVCQDYIDVAYDREVYPIRVSIYETYNPGSVVGIWVADSGGKWSRLWSGPPQIISHKPRIFSPPLQPCAFKTKMLRLEFNHSKLDYYTELDAILLIGTSELIQPHFKFHDKNLSNLLQQLDDSTYNCNDVYNLTPDYLKTHRDLRELKNTFYKHCQLSNSNVLGKIHKGSIVSKLGNDYQCIPPIEEAVNSLHRFLQEDFPKLLRDINLSASTVCAVSRNKGSIASSSTDSCGSFSVLPDEAVLKILNNLDLRSLCRCCQVNKHFNNIARDALLYTSLNLKPYWHCMDANALNNLASRCKYLQKIDLSWCGNYNTITSKDIQNFLTSSGGQLTHLRFNCCQFVTNSVILKVSVVCRNLKELCLRNCLEITKDGFWHLANLMQLERLELYRTTIQTSALCAILKGNQNIRHLNLAACDHIHNMDDIAMEVAYSCPRLESIDFWKSHSLTPHGVRALARCTMLREVDFGWCLGMGAPGDSLRALASSCKNLEKVFLTALRGLTDRDLEPFLCCQKLRQLDFLGARSLTPDICLRFLLRCTKLEMIDLSFCEGISDLKIHEWRTLYPNVSIKRSFQASGIEFTLRIYPGMENSGESGDDGGPLGATGFLSGNSVNASYIGVQSDDLEDDPENTDDSNHGGGDTIHGRGGSCPLREQDRFLPIANVAKIMKRAIPEAGKIAKDARECVQECVSEFISFITSEASDRCHMEKRKTINGEDILFAMTTLGFDNYVEPLKVYLQKYREATKGENPTQGVLQGNGKSGEPQAAIYEDQLFTIATTTSNATTSDAPVIYSYAPPDQMQFQLS